MKKDVNIIVDVNQIATNLIEDAIKHAWDKVKNFFKNIGKKDSIEYRYAYEDYLKKTKDRYCKIKTIIYRKVPKDLYSFYECVGVDYNNNNVSTENIKNLLKISNKLIITGTGGVGKTTLMKHLYLNSISETNYIPVFIELRDFNNMDAEGINLFDRTYMELCNNGFNLEKNYFEFSLSQGAYIFLLDGYDEVNRIKKSKVDLEIKNFSNKYNMNKFIVSSRPSDEFIGWNDFTEVTAKNLTKKQALSLIKKIEFDENIKQKFYSALDKSLYKKYQSFASNPLLLNIMLLTFDSNACIPDNLSDFYEQAFSTLFNMHDATKDAYVRDIRTGLGCEDFKTIFSHICFHSYFKGEFEFTENSLKNYIKASKEKHPNLKFKIDDYKMDLTSSVCMLVKEGLKYRFSHRSFQEYFAALYTCKQTDEVQQALLSEYFKSSHLIGDMYFDLLFTMQPDKVNKIILLPGIKIIKENYENYGFTINFLKTIFSGLACVCYKEEKSISIHIHNRYLCSILTQTCKLNGYRPQDHIFTKTSIVAEKIFNIQKKKTFREIKFEKIGELIPESEITEELNWIKEEVEFAISIYDKYNLNIDKSSIENILKFL